jgi:hypothetical protein
MSEQLSKLELKAIARFLRKVYPGVTEQDSLWNLIAKVEQLAKGTNAKPGRRRGDSSQGA